MKRFSKLCGIPYTTYRNYELGRNRVPFLAAQAIAAATGEDPFSIMAGKASEEETHAQPVAPPREYSLHARGRVSLEGFRKSRDMKDRIPVKVTPEEFGKGDDFLKGGNRFALYARGRSMFPTILEGDLLIFARARKPSSGEIVCATVGNEMMVRRYSRDPRRKVIFLHSDSAGRSPVLIREGKPEMRKFRVEGVLLSLRRVKFK
jgi:SOS-response transcriptional repressor LexA